MAHDYYARSRVGTCYSYREAVGILLAKRFVTIVPHKLQKEK